MKNLFFFFISIFTYSQCYISDLNLNLMHKDNQTLNDFIYSDFRVIEIKKDVANYFYKEHDYFFDYLNEEHKTKLTDFTFKSDKCISNSSKQFNYRISSVDNIIYKIEIVINYKLNELKILESDYIKIKNLLTKIYKIESGIGGIYNVFSDTGEEKKTGSIESYDYQKNKTIKILENGNHIQKVNNVRIAKKKNYKSDINGGGYTNELTSYEIKIDFSNLNGTPLDNRGY